MIDEKKLIEELDAWWETLSPRTETRDSIICDVIESVIEKINNAEKCGEWIPVTERLPEKKGNYLFTATGYDGISVMVCFFDPEDPEDVEFASTGMDLTAWQPLPEPYREESIQKMAEYHIVGKIIKQLQRELELANEERKRCAARNRSHSSLVRGYVRGIENAIEIVKGGAE